MQHRDIFSSKHAERGVVLIFALVALVIVLVGAAAIVRSMNASLSTAGNYGFKRDLGNQAERAVNVAISQFKDATKLGSEAARENSAVALNYSATMLPTNSQGIPLGLMPGETAAFAAVATPANNISIADMGVNVSYIIDRLCDAAGSLGSNSCVWAIPGPPKGGHDGKIPAAADGADVVSSGGGRSAVPRKAVYRLTVRVTGPRSTQAYYQSTFTD